jgi:hypothetical protein
MGTHHFPLVEPPGAKVGPDGPREILPDIVVEPWARSGKIKKISEA